MSLASVLVAEDYVGLLPDTCTIRRKATGGTLDESGHSDGAWADNATDVPCRKEEDAGRELQIGANIVVVNDIFWLKSNADVTEKDRIKHDGLTYEILLVITPQDVDSDHHKEVAVKYIKV